MVNKVGWDYVLREVINYNVIVNELLCDYYGNIYVNKILLMFIR